MGILRLVYEYSSDMTAVEAHDLVGFFVGWPSAPTSTQHLDVLRGSYRAVVARVPGHRAVVGFVNMVSDGVLTAFIPWLEVLPAHQGQGVGSELMRQVLDATDHLYSVDLLCDATLQPYYKRFGMTAVPGMALRHFAALGGPAPN